MHRELLGLSRADTPNAQPNVRRVVPRLPQVFPLMSHPALADAFAAEVERSLEGGLLRYSARAKLLRQARQRGIGQFEANLIIATVQHRRSTHPFAAEVDQAAEGRNRWLQAALAVVATQSLIVLAVWWALLR